MKWSELALFSIFENKQIAIGIGVLYTVAIWQKSNASCECSGYNTHTGNTVYLKKLKRPKQKIKTIWHNMTSFLFLSSKISPYHYTEIFSTY